jgi:hypothetical protein
MYKKLITLCMAMAAFAAVVTPATASANPILLEGGTLVPTGTTLIGKNVGETTITTSLGNLKCTTVTLGGKLTVDTTPLGIEVDIESATFAGDGPNAPNEPDKECTGPFGSFSVTANPPTNGLPWCLEMTAGDSVRLRGGSCLSASRPIRLVLVFTSELIGTCTYQRATAAVGTVNTAEGTAGISEQEWTKFEGGSGCPATGKLDMAFKFETENGTVLTIGS